MTAYKKPTKKQPGLVTLRRAMWDGVCPATDGCKVEPDGICEHGHVSWLIYLGLV